MAHETPIKPKPFRIVIVGAGVVGLTLSHALQLANIDHVVLEKHDKIMSVRGAALIVWPSAERILDQFGFLDKILKAYTPVKHEYRRLPDGSVNRTGGAMNRIAKMFVAQVPFSPLRLDMTTV